MNHLSNHVSGFSGTRARVRQSSQRCQPNLGYDKPTKNKFSPWVQGISSISDEYLTPD
jgi:hypothetical protein